MRICIHCEKEIEGDYKLIALDKPYKNLFLHPECKHAVHKEFGTGSDGMLIYLTQTYEKWYNMEENVGKRLKNKRKRRRKKRT